ncbi:MAG: type 1 glutamine amidotransferase [Bacteroidales bacterium]|nr:type 1 glutamine amidotransferase [Bacteroidales bacterium]
MNIHFILHESFEGPGCILDWARQKNFNISYTKVYENEEFPDPESLDWLVIMGGTANAFDRAKFLWLQPEIVFINKCISQDKIILGICLGAQLLATSMGSRVYPGQQKEIGWFPVEFKVSEDEELNFLPAKQTVFHWHGDTFDIPEEAVHIFSSELTPNQGFIYQNRVVALQFHLEVKPEDVQLMMAGAGQELTIGEYVQTKEVILKEDRFYIQNQKFMFQLLDYLWVNRSVF